MHPTVYGAKGPETVGFFVEGPYDENRANSLYKDHS